MTYVPGGGGGGASRISNLTDVALSSPTDNQALIYDENLSLWRNETIDPDVGGDVSGTVSNVLIKDAIITAPKLAAGTNPTGGQYLSYDGTGLAWSVPASLDPVVGGDVTGTSSNVQIAAGVIGAVELATNAVTSAKILNAQIITAKLADGAVTAAKLASNSVGTTAIIDGAISEAKFDSAVQSKLNNINNSITVSKAGVDVGSRPKLNFVEGSNVTISATEDGANDQVTVSISAAGVGGAADATTTSKGIIQLAGDLSGTSSLPRIATGAVTSTQLANDSVTNAAVANNAINTAELANDAVSAAKLQGGAVDASKLDTSSNPTSGQLLSYNGSSLAWVNESANPLTLGGDLSGTTSSAQIAAGVIGSTELADNSVGNTKLQANAISNSKIANGAVTTTKILDANVTSAKLVDDAVTEPKLAISNSPTTGQVLSWNGVALAWVSSGSGGAGDPSMGGDLTGLASNAQIAVGAVGSSEIATDAVTNTKIATAAIDGTKLAANSVTQPKIASSNVPSTGHILSWNGTALQWVANGNPDPTLGGDLSGTASSAQIVASAVGATELATNAVTTAKVADANITTAKVADSAITSIKLADDAVTEPKLAVSNSPLTGYVLSWNGSSLAWVSGSSGAGDPTLGGDLSGTASNAQIVASAIGATELAANAVTNSKIANTAVTTVKISDNNVTTAKIADANITTAKLADDAVTEPKLAATNTPTIGQYLSYDGTNLSWSTPSSSGDPVVGGDLSGTASNAQLVSNAVATANIATGAVTQPKIGAGNTPTAGQVLSYNGTGLSWINNGSGGGGSAPATVATAYVYQSGGNTIAVNRAGSVISSLATSAANNVTVINAAISAASGVSTAGGYGGGGLVLLSDDQYLINASIVMRYGTSLKGVSQTMDRGGAVYNSASQVTNGTSLRATANNIRAIVIGVATPSSGVHLSTNPHGCEISDLQVDGHGATGVTGIYMIDTTDVHITNVTTAHCTTGIDVDSTQPPNSGGTVATKIVECNILGSNIGIDISGSDGGTDGEITSCRILGHQVAAINLLKGGWQITQCHFTSGKARHINLSGSPTMLTNNYFDTSGADAQIYLATGNVNITGNYFISETNQATASIEMSGNGMRSSIVGNTVDVGAAQKAFIKLPSGTVSAMPVIVSGNILDTSRPTGFVSIVVNSSFAAVADQDTANGPYIKGNRVFP